MKIMNGVRILFALIALAAVQIDAVKTKKTRKTKTEKRQPEVKEVDAVLDEVRNELEIATNKAAKDITASTIEKNRARKAVIDGVMTEEAAAVIIEAQDKKIAEIKQDLMKLAEGALAAADETEEQASYMSQFIGGAKSLGAGILAPFRAGYGYSEQEKNLARAVIAELEELKKDETDQAVIQKLDDEIYQQQLISGDAMSTRQKLLIGAAMVAAGVAGYALSGYLGGSEIATVTDGGSSSMPLIKTEQLIKPLIETEQLIKPLTGMEVVYEGAKPGESGIAKGVIAIKTGLEKGALPEDVYEGFEEGGQSSIVPVAESFLKTGAKPTEEIFEGADESGIAKGVIATKTGLEKGALSEDVYEGFEEGGQSSIVPVAESFLKTGAKPTEEIFEGADESGIA